VTALPTEDEVRGYAKTLSNWGRWGKADERGALNLITEAKRKEAMGLAKRGQVVSLAWDIDPAGTGPDVKAQPQRYMLRTGQGATEGAHPERQIACHGQDSLSRFHLRAVRLRNEDPGQQCGRYPGRAENNQYLLSIHSPLPRIPQEHQCAESDHGAVSEAYAAWLIHVAALAEFSPAAAPE